MNSNPKSQLSCCYDGLVIFTRQESFIDYLKDHSHTYNIKVEIDNHTNQLTEHFKGEFKNFKIQSARNSTGYGVVISGSIHKYFDRKDNSERFLWVDFIQAYNLFLQDFPLDPTEALLWNLECGLNNFLPPSWEIKASNFPGNTVYLMGDPKSISQNKYSRGAISLHVKKGECLAKFYDKGQQFKKDREILRTECSCKTRPLKKMGFIYLSDLIDRTKQESYYKYLLKTFETLIIYQSEALPNPLIPINDKEFLLNFRSRNAWTELKKNNYYRFKKAKERFNNLMTTYCPVNYKEEIIKLMKAQIL